MYSYTPIRGPIELNKPFQTFSRQTCSNWVQDNHDQNTVIGGPGVEVITIFLILFGLMDIILIEGLFLRKFTF